MKVFPRAVATSSLFLAFAVPGSGREEARSQAPNMEKRNTEIREAILARATEEDWERLTALRERIVESTPAGAHSEMEEYRDPIPRAAEYPTGFGEGFDREGFPKGTCRLEMVPIRGGALPNGQPSGRERPVGGRGPPGSKFRFPLSGWRATRRRGISTSRSRSPRIHGTRTARSPTRNTSKTRLRRISSRPRQRPTRK